ncbi:MAG: hypothetical protein CL840_00905 [Crocinitomicaceae bacterium]|nr:hypothetical protein [Crocinitomicaceae bacterium]|tara:strand:+ start:100405 stop:100887 length:483 start_codon:yes stop_codon:yes gene_type:complete
MYRYKFPLKAMAGTTGIPLDTLKTWRQVSNRLNHCKLVELAHLRLKDDPAAQSDLNQDISIQDYASHLGFDNPFKTGAPIPPTTLRQWDKDGDHGRIKMFLLGYQTLLLKSALGKDWDIFKFDCALRDMGLVRSQVVRLIRADLGAAKKLLSHLPIPESA